MWYTEGHIVGAKARANSPKTDCSTIAFPPGHSHINQAVSSFTVVTVVITTTMRGDVLNPLLSRRPINLFTIFHTLLVVELPSQ